MKRVSIIIATYKNDGFLRNCLVSLAETCGTEPEIVVADNSPCEETRRLVNEYSNAKYVPSPGNPGFAGGNNRALPHCSRPYLLLLNNDTTVRSAESIRTLVSFLDANPKCSVAQGTMTLPNCGGILGGCGSFLSPFGFLIAHGYGIMPECGPAATPIFSAIGAFMLVRREAIAKAGGLFRTHFWCYYEETDFCHRVWITGGEVWYVPTIPIEHYCGGTSAMFDRPSVLRRHLRNQWFSLASTTGWFFLPALACVMLLYGLIMRGDSSVAISGAFADIRRSKSRIRAARRQIKRIRTVGEFSILRRTVRLPSLRYVLRSLGLIH